MRPKQGLLMHCVTPQSAGWQYLHFEVLSFETSDKYVSQTLGNEVLLVFLSGSARVEVADEVFVISGRSSVFDGLPFALYLPPNTTYTIIPSSQLEVAWGGAPALGKFGVKLLEPPDFRTELRGGANVTRHISHIISPDVWGEKLFVFEVYTPSGNWSGFPPHRHDGRDGSSYLEETYYFKISPKNGFGSIRLYTKDTPLDEFKLVQHNDLVLVKEGYHPTNAAPGSNLYFLNFLVGHGTDYIVSNDPDFDWVKDDWTGEALELPLREK